jgi:Family of unknown function (DUF6600)
MIVQTLFRRFLLGVPTALTLAIAGVSMPVAVGGATPAYAQVSPEFRQVLDSYGHWLRTARYGEVWVPDGVPPGWRPYDYGHWVYTDDWGWYWVSDEQEEDWGWVTYHYGRWAFERRIGWFWVPGDEWAPAWVDWRYGDDYVGWAPLPPDEDIEVYDAEPDYWVFVPIRHFAAPSPRSYYVRRDRRAFYLRSTHVINRTLAVHGARLAVNPGISPAYVARVTHAALPTYRVRPRVLGSTQGVAGAVHVRPEELRKPASGARQHFAPVAIQRTTASIAPSTSAASAAPKPLRNGERGALGSHPPLAAQRAGTPQQPPLSVTPAIRPVEHGGVKPAVKPVVPGVQNPQRREEHREPHAPSKPTTTAPASQQPRAKTIQPVAPQSHPVTPPRPPHPPEVHRPPAVVHAPPPRQVHAPPPRKPEENKREEKKPEPPK